MTARQRDKQADEPVADTEATNMSDQNAADLLASKVARGTSKEWGPFKKASTEIPERLVGASFAILQPAIGTIPEETWENILLFSGGSHQAALDTFNSAYRLDNQKTLKASFIPDEGQEPMSVAALQEVSNRHTASASTRGKGSTGGAKARAVRAEAKVAVAQQSMEEMISALAEHDPAAADAFRERMEALGS